MLSIIIPFVNEHPQIAFTLQSLLLDLRGQIPFEVIAIENWNEHTCGERQKRTRDKGFEYLKDAPKNNPELKVLHYGEKLSHWQAKNYGVAHSSGDTLLFLDGHVLVSPGSIGDMYCHYRQFGPDLNGTLHLPICYFLDRKDRALIYKPVVEKEKSVWHYSFTSYGKHPQGKVIQVACMSTCGMMMDRGIYNQLGGWPKELGIYGGGEHFINFTLAVLGKTVNIYPANPLYHYAAPRDYNWYYDDYHRNRCIATYMFAGADAAKNYMKNTKGDQTVLQAIADDVISKEFNHFLSIQKQKVQTIEEWWAKWEERSRS